VIVPEPAGPVAFTDAELARAKEIRAWAEAPEHFVPVSGWVDNSRQADIFQGVVVAYGIAEIEHRSGKSRRWKILRFGTPAKAGLPPPRLCALIAEQLFDFDRNVPHVKMDDPTDRDVLGVAQPFEPPS
jgi:hypothetical protein